MAQPSGGSRDENETNTSDRLRASTIVRDKKKQALTVLGKKINSGSNFSGFNFGQKCVSKTCISLQHTVLYRQGSGNGT